MPSKAYPSRTDSIFIRPSIRSLVECYRLLRSDPSSALPLRFKNMGYTKIYFGENQLSPCSIGISPLTTTHPSHLQLTLVRTSIRLSPNFILVMVSSHGFGSLPICIYFALLTLAFTLPADLLPLDYRLGKLTGSFFNRHAITRVNSSSNCLLAFNFRYFSFPFRGTLSPFPHGTSSLSVATHI